MTPKTKVSSLANGRQAPVPPPVFFEFVLRGQPPRPRMMQTTASAPLRVCGEQGGLGHLRGPGNKSRGESARDTPLGCLGPGAPVVWGGGSQHHPSRVGALPALPPGLLGHL